MARIFLILAFLLMPTFAIADEPDEPPALARIEKARQARRAIFAHARAAKEARRRAIAARAHLWRQAFRSQPVVVDKAERTASATVSKKGPGDQPL